MNTTLNITDNFKTEIDELWNNEKFAEIEVLKRGYGVHAEVIKNSILFIGINPSYTKNSKQGSYFIHLDQDGINEQRDKPFSYFTKFIDITRKLNNKQNTPIPISWSHIDLLFHRETNQKFIKQIKKTPNGNEFINQQILIAKKIIVQSEPKIIIVSNTKARDFLKNKNNQDELEFEFMFDKELGTEKIVNHPTLKNVPVFFTSMLTGQRAMDLGSYERLIWHINFVLEKLKK